MEKEIVLSGECIKYILRESNRAKTVNVTLHRDGLVVVSLPKRAKERDAERFLREKEKWILSHLEKVRNDKGIYLPNHKGHELYLLKEYASLFIKRKIEQLNQHYKFKISKISVKNQKSQWGSCSTKKNLNFTYKIILLPSKLAEYVIAHELCHIQEFNHSKNFWNLLEEMVPESRELNKELRQYYL